MRWDLDPPCSEAEWAYLADLPQAPEVMAKQTCGYMNKICRACYSARLDVMGRVKSRIRQVGGLEQMKPTQRMRKEYEEAHAGDVVANRPAKINGLQSVNAAHMNGQFCKLVSKDEQTQRWTVQLLGGEQKSVKEANLEVSREIDAEYDTARAMHELQRRTAPPAKGGPGAGAGAGAGGAAEEKRPLGQRTAWPKVKGIHPGAVVRLQHLQGAPELNGRTGRCIRFDPENGRWEVDLGDQRKALKVENLSPAAGEKPPTKQSAEEEKKAFVEKLDTKSQMSAKEVYAESYGWDG